MKKLMSGLVVLVLLVGFSVHASERDDLFIQVDLDGGPDDECSILKVKPDGTLSEFVPNARILLATGLNSADCNDTGLAVALDGRVFFSEDSSDNILVANVNGQVKNFVTDTVVNTLVPNTVDWDNGMDVNPVTGTLVAADEDNEVIFEFPTDVPTPITNPALIKILADEADFAALVTTVQLEGGIAIDEQQNIYIANDDSDNDVDNVIFKLTPQGDLSIFCTQAQLAAATGTNNIDLDVGMTFGGSLFVADDGTCDCVLKIDPAPGGCNPQVLITEDQINAVTGNTSADLEGGICIDTNMNLFLGDDGDGPAGNDLPNIVKVPIADPVNASLFVTAAEVDDFYATRSPGRNARFEGSCDIKQVDSPPAAVPTLSEWGLIAMALALGVIGFVVMRKRMVRA